jgi:glutamyl-tRNA reductase
MPTLKQTDISTFFVAGVNYKKTDATMRGQYAINNEQYGKLLELAPQYGIAELFVISTCNRTEIYGFTENVNDLCQLLCSQALGSVETFKEIAYIKNGRAAILHLFDVAAGLDSQILGDYEILGQLKQAFKFSKEHGFIGAYSERLMNAVLQSSKSIKTNTGLSDGTVSVAFAAIQYIKEKVQHAAGKKILLIGTGKIGRNTCKNLVDYIQAKNITLINRTESRAAELAAELGLKFAGIDELPNYIKESDIILVATNSDVPVIEEFHLINSDELSKIKDATLHKREAEVPKAQAIIKEKIDEFLEWHEMRKNVPVLTAVKNKLYAMQSCEMYISYSARKIAVPAVKVNFDYEIQKVVSGMAIKMRSQNQYGCQYIQAINEYIATGTI